MAQTSVTAVPGQVGAIQVDRCRVGSDVRDTAIRSKYEAVRPEEQLRLAENVESHFPNHQHCFSSLLRASSGINLPLRNFENRGRARFGYFLEIICFTEFLRFHCRSSAWTLPKVFPQQRYQLPTKPHPVRMPTSRIRQLKVKT